MSRNLVAVAAAVATLLSGCGPSAPPPQQDPGLDMPSDGSPYAAPPYGLTKGETLRNIELFGYRVYPNDWQVVRLSEFYDPNGNKGPNGVPLKLLAINVSALWCSVCRWEAPILEETCKANRAKGLACYTGIFENAAQDPAARKDVNSWASDYKIDYPIVLDSAFVWGAFFNKTATPMNMFVDPKTMKIIEVTIGADMKQMKSFLLGAIPDADTTALDAAIAQQGG